MDTCRGRCREDKVCKKADTVEKCVAWCAFKMFIGGDPIEIMRNADFAAAEFALHRMAKRDAVKALEHFLPYAGQAETIYDSAKTAECTWRCSRM